MGEIEGAIERADREAFTREPPKMLKGRIGYLIRQLGSAKAVAREIGVTVHSANRYRRGARKHARPDVTARIESAVAARWQPQVRKRQRRQADTATGGVVAGDQAERVQGRGPRTAARLQRADNRVGPAGDRDVLVLSPAVGVAQNPFR